MGGRGTSRSALRRMRGYADDPAIALPYHDGDEGLQAVEGSLAVHRHHEVPLVGIDLMHRDLPAVLFRRDAGVVHQDVDATELRRHPANHAPDLFPRTHIHLEGERIPSEGLDTGGGGLGGRLVLIRDDEVAAEASGVPTLRLKLLATTVSGAFMGMAGAPLPYYVTYLDPTSGFSLAYAVNGVAMPLVGGTSSWLGPVIGAILLGTLQQVATVTISSALNLLIVGLMLVAFVIVAPNGILGLLRFRGGRSR